MYASSPYPGVMSNPVLENTQGCLAIGPSYIGSQITGVSNPITISSIAIGDVVVSGNQSIAIGTGGNFPYGYVTGQQAIAIGDKVTSSGLSVAIGTSSYASGQSTSIGYTASASGQHAVGIGAAAAANIDYSIAIGSTSKASFHGGALGDNADSGSTTTDGGYGSWAIGNYAKVDFNGEFVFSSGYLSSAGDAKTSIVTLRGRTTNATPLELGATYGASTAPSTYIRLTTNSTYSMQATIVGRNKTSAGNDFIGVYQFDIAQDANAASTTLIGSVTTVRTNSRGTITGWSVAITADTTIGGPNISVTGVAATTIDWVATVTITKVG
jgi:hypothetical protein